MKAFPGNRFEGMELRDYFAAKAMERLIDLITHPKDVAKNAYKIADAMMEERKNNELHTKS
jgi:hypothetical protein